MLQTLTAPGLTTAFGGTGPRGGVWGKILPRRVVVAMAAYGGSWEYIDSAFVWSLRCTGYDGDLVLITSPEAHAQPSPRLKAYFQVGFRISGVWVGVRG